MRTESKTIGVDLTPLRRGGANGGIKPLIFHSLRTLRQLLDHRATFVFFTNSESHDELRPFARHGDRIVCVTVIPGCPPPSLITLLHREFIDDDQNPFLLIDHGVDVLHCPFGAVPLACPGVPAVSCISDLLHRDFPSSISGDERAHRERYLTETMRVSDALNCVSQYIIGRVHAHYPEFSGKLLYTYNVIHERFNDVTAVAVPRLPVGPYFYYPANYWVHKNHEILLIAYQMYRARAGMNAWPLVLTGHEDARADEIKAIAASLDLTGHVLFFDHVEMGELKTIWQNCGALVFPSLHEGFGIPLLEAMHFAKPIIASNASCLPEIAGDAAHLIDARKPEELAAALHALATSSENQASLSKRSVNRLNQFDFQIEMQKLADVLLTIRTRRLWRRGVGDDGWLAGRAVIALPAHEGRWQLSLELLGGSTPSMLSISAGALPLGTHRVGPGENRRFDFWIRDPRGPLRLSVRSPHASAQVLHLSCITLTPESGEPLVLYTS